MKLRCVVWVKGVEVEGVWMEVKGCKWREVEGVKVEVEV